MAKKWSLKIETSAKFESLEQNRQFSRILTLKCMVSIGKNEMGEGPSIMATPPAYKMVNHYYETAIGGYICMCLYVSFYFD